MLNYKKLGYSSGTKKEFKKTTTTKNFKFVLWILTCKEERGSRWRLCIRHAPKWILDPCRAAIDPLVPVLRGRNIKRSVREDVKTPCRDDKNVVVTPFHVDCSDAEKVVRRAMKSGWIPQNSIGVWRCFCEYWIFREGNEN